MVTISIEGRHTARLDGDRWIADGRSLEAFLNASIDREAISTAEPRHDVAVARQAIAWLRAGGTTARIVSIVDDPLLNTQDGPEPDVF